MFRIFLIMAVTVAPLALASAIEPRSGCEIEQLTPAIPPLLIRNGQSEFIYPNYGEQTLKFASGEVIEMACPGGRLLVLGEPTTAVVQAECISGIRFRINGERFLWRQVSCSQNPFYTVRFTGLSCTGGREVEIGYDLGDGRFVRTILVCFDTVAQGPIWTYFDLTRSIASRVGSPARPSFIQGSGFYSLGSSNVNNMYARATQRATINSQVGLSATSTKYVQANTNYFLARGHLVARSDFLYHSQMNATFFYVNAAPQWQTFNGFNWNEVEISVRNYADNHGVDLQVWTGVYGVTTLPHETTGRPVQLYLYVDNNGNKALPLPEIYWKVVYNPISRRGIALIGLNNPFQTDVSGSILCTDVSRSISWLSWDRTNIKNGYSYACAIADLRRVVTSVPNLNVAGLLL